MIISIIVIVILMIYLDIKFWLSPIPTCDSVVCSKLVELLFYLAGMILLELLRSLNYWAMVLLSFQLANDVLYNQYRES